MESSFWGGGRGKDCGAEVASTSGLVSVQPGELCATWKGGLESDFFFLWVLAFLLPAALQQMPKVCTASWLSLVSSCCFVICRRSRIIFPGRQPGCSGTQLLPACSVLLLQTAHRGSPGMCAVCYFFGLTCSANPARLFGPHTTSFSVCCLRWNEVTSLSLRPFNRSLCPSHLPSHPAVLRRGYRNRRLIVRSYKDLTSESAVARYGGLVRAPVLTVSQGLSALQLMTQSDSKAEKYAQCTEDVVFIYFF